MPGLPLFLWILVTVLYLFGASNDMVVSCLSPPRVALVTGANKGIGKEIVRLLAKTKPLHPSSSEEEEEDSDSWIILLGSRDPTKGEETAKELIQELSKNSNKVQIICCPLDLTDDTTIESAKELVKIHCGKDGKLDVLINNAAICFNDPTLYGKVPHTPFEQQADITIRTNFFGTLKVTRAMLPFLLREQQSSSSPSRIINIASAAGRLAILKSDQLVQTFTSPELQLSELESLLERFVKDVEAGIHATKGWPNTCYGMSKLGIIAMTKVLARDYADKIMCNSVDPGYCATDQNNNQGTLPAERGAVTPVVLATLNDENFVTGRHFFQEREIEW